MSKVDDAVDLINGHYEDSFWGNDAEGFQDDQARESLDALADLTAGEFEEAFDRLNDTRRETLAETAQAQGLDDDDKYRQIINSLATGDPSAVVEADREPQFAGDTGQWSGLGPGEGEHGEDATLWIPRGASKSLISLILDTQFTMQWGFDTLGIGNPEAAPDFTTLLDGELVTDVDGWSQIRSDHDALNTRLTERQNEHTGEDGGVRITTMDTEITGSDVYTQLKEIKDNLNERLKFEFPDATRRGDEIMAGSSGGPSYSETQVAVYEMNADENSDNFGKFYLTAASEQRYFVRYIDQAAEDWERKYAEATEEFQKHADQIDNGDTGDDGGGNGDGDDGGDSGDDGGDSGDDGGESGDVGDEVGSSYPGQDSGFPLPVQDASTAEAGLLDEDFSSTYDDLLGASVDTADPLDSTSPGDVQSGLDSTGSGTPSGTDLSSLTSAAQDSGTGSGTGMTTSSTSTPASSDSGADALSQMAMMSALGQMANQVNRPARDDSGHDERDSREDPPREDEQNRIAPAATTDPGVQTPPPGVTAPTYAGAPPPVTTPGAMVDVPIDNTTVKASQPVAEALQKQVQNVAMDAISAYRGTAGEVTADHPPAVVNGPGELKTGDILQWERHSALIVKDKNGLFVLDNGHLVPLDPNNPPLKEKYGNFTGYIHPSGLDGAAGGDPASAAPPPPTGSTAQPAGPPPVSPPQV
ncbi:hypothetical protein [Nocardia gipuzkoensis]